MLVDRISRISPVQLFISLFRRTHTWDNELNTRKKNYTSRHVIVFLYSIYFVLFLLYKMHLPKVHEWYYLQTVSVSFDCLFLQISYKSVAKPRTKNVSYEEKVYKDTCKNQKRIWRKKRNCFSMKLNSPMKCIFPLFTSIFCRACVELKVWLYLSWLALN